MIFKEPKNNSFFLKNGYVVLNYYSSADIKDLHDQFVNINPSVKSDYYSTIDSNNEIKEKINNLLKTFFTPFIDSIFNDRKYTFGAFTMKNSGEQSIKPSHQDWSFVDEAKHQGIGLWCPLIDVNEVNGALGVIPGSHNYFFNRRGTGTRTEYEEVSQYLEKNLFKFLKMKKGQVLIFDNRLIHFSKPNLSKQERIVAGCATVDKDAQIIHYVGKNEGLLIQTRNVDESFFMNEDFSKIKFEDGQGYEEIKLDKIDQIKPKEIFQLIAKHDTRLYYKIKYLIKQKLTK